MTEERSAGRTFDETSPPRLRRATASTSTITRPDAARRVSRPGRLPLNPGRRKATLVLHIVAAGAWIGIDVIVAVLVLTGWFGDQTSVRSLAYQALATFVVWPMLSAGLVCLGTGLLLGLGTRWGLIRYWWVAVKLVLNVVLCTLIVLVLRPGMGEVARYGQDLLTGGGDPGTVSSLFFAPAVSLTTLTLATVLAVFKPWGRIRR